GRDPIEHIRFTEPNRHSRIAGNSVSVDLKPGIEIDFRRLERHFYTSSSCGVCGKASLEALAVQGCTLLPRTGLRIRSAMIPELPQRLRKDQAVFDRTGGLHAAALFDSSGE